MLFCLLFIISYSICIASQQLIIITYGSDKNLATHLISFSKRYHLNIHLIGNHTQWNGFNDKIQGFYDFMQSMDINRDNYNETIILILDAYDTIIICNESQLLSKFNSFSSDIVIPTQKFCWPDPNVASFVISKLSTKQKQKYQHFLPWFSCPNSGAIMGRYHVMLTLFERLKQLVSIGNGSCHDFEGNAFNLNTQSDQRCLITYIAQSIQYNENKQKHKALEPFYKNIKIKLDHETRLFLTLSAMLFTDIHIVVDNDEHQLEIINKITNHSICILHGGGPGMILWQQFVKQIKNNGILYIDDQVLRYGSDIIHSLIIFFKLPYIMETLSHWFSIHFGFDLGSNSHSTGFDQQRLWGIHVKVFFFVTCISGILVLCWYKYVFIKHIKVNKLKISKMDKRV